MKLAFSQQNTIEEKLNLCAKGLIEVAQSVLGPQNPQKNKADEIRNAKMMMLKKIWYTNEKSKETPEPFEKQ